MSLSDRLRPNIEAAPWVIEEIKELEKAYQEQEEELDATMMAFNILKKENARLREALEILAAENSGTCCECWDVKDIARAALEQK